MTLVVKHIITGFLAFNILLFSAGISLVDYHCGQCNDYHQELVLSMEHLAHDHGNGHCHITELTQGQETHKNHKNLQLKDLQRVSKDHIKVKTPVLKNTYRYFTPKIKFYFNNNIQTKIFSFPVFEEIFKITSVLLL